MGVAEFGPGPGEAAAGDPVEPLVLGRSHSTGNAVSGMPPPFSGSGASLVHSTMPSRSGSPEVTPRVNTPSGSAEVPRRHGNTRAGHGP